MNRIRIEESCTFSETRVGMGFLYALQLLTLLAACLGAAIASGTSLAAAARNVTYDVRAIVIDGQRRLLISASIHYPRSTPEMWPDLIAKAKQGGVDVIESYMFWNAHEPQRGKYVFDGRLDLIRFIREVQNVGLYFHLRIGPYACAEWNYGGFPAWLHFLPGIKLRTDNAVFKGEMERITRKIVNMLKQQNLFYWQGGPIILTQIENEYGNIDEPYGPPGKRYMHWAAQMAVAQDTKMPWVMCQQKDAPDPIINTCNGFYCDQFRPNSPYKPKMWTENWTGWFLAFGGLEPHRPVEDIAFAVARFFQTGGTFQNYYMYHGGTNFERTAGGPFIATTYDYDAPIDEYGLLRQPKWGHLTDLHTTLKLCEKPLLYGDVRHLSWGPEQQAAVYKTTANEWCVFLSNKDKKNDANVKFNGKIYSIPAWSVSILTDGENVTFNTAQVRHQTTVMSMETVPQAQITASNGTALTWKFFKETVGALSSNSFMTVGFLDQFNVTRDTTDYLWYTTTLYSNACSVSQLSLRSLGDNMLIFLNGELIGNGYGSYDGPPFQLQIPVSLKEGPNQLSLLSSTVGLKNYGSFFDTTGTGIDGPTSIIHSNSSEKIDLSFQEWTYTVGLVGEKLGLFSEEMNLNPTWVVTEKAPMYQPVTWYKTTFNTPPGEDPVAIDLASMGKGQAWVNGYGLGRYWSTYTSSNLGCFACDYRGPYSSTKCTQNCGQPSQRWYHIPRAWLKKTGNLLVMFEEVGGDPTQITFVTRVPGTICSHVSEVHPTLTSSTNTTIRAPAMSLDCGMNRVISSIEYASYGTPQGTCQHFSHGSCHAKNSIDIVKEACIGKQGCSISMSVVGTILRGPDTCPTQNKSFAAQAVCTSIA